VALSWGELADWGISDNGVFTVGATATNGEDRTAVAFATLTVRNTPPTVLPSGAAGVYVGQTYVVTLAATDPGADTVSQWQVYWGDGSLPEVFPSDAVTAAHVYMRPARWTSAWVRSTRIPRLQPSYLIFL